MCVVCLMWDKDQLTPHEAREAIKEIAEDNNADWEHLCDLWDMIQEYEEMNASRRH